MTKEEALKIVEGHLAQVRYLDHKYDQIADVAIDHPITEALQIVLDMAKMNDVIGCGSVQ